MEGKNVRGSYCNGSGERMAETYKEDCMCTLETVVECSLIEKDGKGKGFCYLLFILHPVLYK